MGRYEAVCLPGDGVGPELVSEAKRVLAAVRDLGGPVVDLTERPVGLSAYRTCGNALPDETLAAIRERGIALLGAIDAAKCPPPSPVGQMRRELGLYAEVRPACTLNAAASPRDKVDVVVIRELAEGFLPDRNMWRGSGEFMPTEDVALAVRVITRSGAERICRFALRYAKQHGRKRLTAVHKATVFRLTCGLFRDAFREVTLSEHSEIEIAEGAVDEVAGQLVSDPDKFDVLVTTNLFGDILSDVASALVGGMVPAASFGDGVAVFRPAHETLPDLAGKGTVNPLPTFLALAMMLRWVGEVAASNALSKAAAQTASKLGLSSLRLEGYTTGAVTDVFCRLVGEEYADGTEHR